MSSGVRIVGICAALAVLGAYQSADAQTRSYPAEQIRIIVPFGPAGGPDLTVRALSPAFQNVLGQKVIVDNRPGANGITGTRAAAIAPPDGYTILGGSSAFPTAASTTPNLGYNPLKDFAPIGLYARSGGYELIVRAASEYKTLSDLLDAGRKSTIYYGSPGLGNVTHLAAALFADKSGVPFKHIPYPTMADAVHAVETGEVTFVFTTAASIVGQIQSGSVRVIAYTGDTPMPEMPDVPLLKDSVPGYRLGTGWSGLMAPAKTPAAVIDVLSKALQQAAADPETKARLATIGYASETDSPEQFGQYLETDISVWREAAKAAGY